jgi:ligand-binding sensor domain-containing protein
VNGTVGDGLIIRGKSGHLIRAYEQDPQSSIVNLSFAEDSSGDLWAGTQSGLVRFSNTGMTLWRIANTSGSDFGTVFIDRDNSVWLSTGKVTRLAKGNQEEIRFRSLDGLRVRATFRDAFGALWVGTMGHGAYRYVTGRPTQNFSSELGTGFVTGFLNSSDGAVWISTDSGVAKWHNGSVTTFQNVKGAPHEPVLCVANAPDGGLWVGTSRDYFCSAMANTSQTKSLLLWEHIASGPFMLQTFKRTKPSLWLRPRVQHELVMAGA